MKALLAILLAAAGAAAQTPCFTITVDSKMSSDGGKQTEEHHFVAAFKAHGSAGCSVAALEPGLTRRFFLADIHATSKGREGKQTGSSRLDGVDDHNRNTSVDFTRDESGGTLEFSAMSPTPSDDRCQECIHMCGAQVFDPWPNTFKLTEQELTHFGSVTKSVKLTMNMGENGCTGTATAVLNGSLGSEEEMVLEPADDYGTWLPAPDSKQMAGVRFTASTRLKVTARIKPKQGNSEPRSGRIDFHLEDVSRHKGVCENYPRGGAEKDDLKFASDQPKGIVVEGKTAHTTDDVTEASVYVEATDFAAWGKITASAPKLSLKARYKPTNKEWLAIPRDDDGNKIADAWEGTALEAASDDEEVSGQDAKGDGMTAAGEYRGFVVLENGQKVHHRFNPKRKEMFVIDSGGIFDAGAWEGASQIVGYKLDDSMVQGGSGAGGRVVNFLSSTGQSKYAVRLETIGGITDPADPTSTVWGYTEEWPIASPKDAIRCRVYKDRVRATLVGLYEWLGRALNVPGSQEEAEFKALDLPLFVARNAYQQLGAGKLDELWAQVLRLCAIHEVGHATGLPGHLNAKGVESADGDRICPMRYRTEPGSKRYLILQSLFGSDAGMGSAYKAFCRSEFNCFRKLNVKD